jgi:hypothetical protein
MDNRTYARFQPVAGEFFRRVRSVKDALDHELQEARGQDKPFCIRNKSDFEALIEKACADQWFRRQCGSLTVDQFAVLKSLACVAQESQWPPPPSSICDKLLKCALPEDGQRHLRAPEIAIAHLAGWARETVDFASDSWDGILRGAAQELQQEMYVSVDAAFTWLTSRVIGFSKPHTGDWTARIFRSYTAERGRCRCWTKSKGASVPAGMDVDTVEIETLNDIPNLRANAFQKAITCLTWHSIRGFDPTRLKPAPKRSPDVGEQPWTLWEHLQRAVKGFIGHFDQHGGGFTAGMLFHLLTQKYKLKSVKMAEFFCPICERWTVKDTNCGFFGHAMPGPPDLRARAVKGRLVLDGAGGGYVRRLVWTCSDEECKKRTFSGRKTYPNIYPASVCLNQCADDGRHDECPCCHAPHPQKNRRRLSTVYFYRDPVNPPSGTSQAAEPRGADVTEPPETLLPFALFQGVANEVAQTLAGCVEGVVFWFRDCCAHDDVRGIGLIQSGGAADWLAIHTALRGFGYEDCPDTPADLQEKFEHEAKTQMIETLREHCQKVDIDWKMIEDYRDSGHSEKEEHDND